MAEQPSYHHRVPIFLGVTCTPWRISSSKRSTEIGLRGALGVVKQLGHLALGARPRPKRGVAASGWR